MYSGNVQQNSICVESCVTMEFSISPRFSPTIFDPDAKTVLLRAHLCTAAVDSMRRKPRVRNCLSEREGLCCVFSSLSFWISSSLDVPAGVTQEEGHTGFFMHLSSAVRALTFLARRIQPSLSLVDREVELCVLYW